MIFLPHLMLTGNTVSIIALSTNMYAEIYT